MSPEFSSSTAKTTRMTEDTPLNKNPNATYSVSRTESRYARQYKEPDESGYPGPSSFIATGQDTL
jgi:hypothetical protein